MVTIRSHSLAAFLTCPTKYRLSVLLGIQPEENTIPLLKGSAFHAMVANEEFDWDTVDADTSKEVKNAFGEYSKQYSGDTLSLREHEFEFYLQPNLKVGGRIDGIIEIAGRKMVHELKTTTKPLTQAGYWKYRFDAQSIIYVLACRMGAIEGCEKVNTILYDVIRWSPLTFARKEYAVLESDLDRTVSLIKKIGNTIEFYQTNGGWPQNWLACDSWYPCPYKNICLSQEMSYDSIVNGVIPKGFVRSQGLYVLENENGN